MLFLMFFIVPAAMRFLAAFAGSGAVAHHSADPRNRGLQLAPAYDAQTAFENAKRDFPGQLIDFDTKLSEAEDFGSDLNAAELKSAREHLNQAFAAYAQHFQGDAPVSADVKGAIKLVSKHLNAANRHLLLADPNTAAEVAAMDEKLRLAEAEAGRAAAAKAKAQAEAQAANEAYGYDMFGDRYAARPVRRTSVQVTPFGIMIGSF